MTEDERIVRGAWKEVRYVDTGPSLWVRTHYVIIGHPQLFAAYRNTRGEAWLAARDFTEQRLEQIRQIKQEIALLVEAQKSGVDCSRWERIRLREQAALAELRRGMKEGK